MIPRVEKDGTPILFLPDMEYHDGRIACYSEVGQHAWSTEEYYRQYTRKPRRWEADKLVAEYRQIAGEYCTLRQRLSHKEQER